MVALLLLMPLADTGPENIGITMDDGRKTTTANTEQYFKVCPERK